MLEAHLEASILAEQDATAGGALDAAIAEHQALLRDRKTREATRTGFGWLRTREPVAERELARTGPLP